MLWLIWLIFAALFIYLAFIHWRESTKSLPPFQPPEIPLLEFGPEEGYVNIGLTAPEIKKVFDDYKGALNVYIADINKSSHKQNQLQALGYFVAFLTAIASLIISLPSS